MHHVTNSDTWPITNGAQVRGTSKAVPAPYSPLQCRSPIILSAPLLIDLAHGWKFLNDLFIIKLKENIFFPIYFVCDRYFRGS